MNNNKLFVQLILVLVFGFSAFFVNMLWKMQNVPTTEKYMIFKNAAKRGDNIKEKYRFIELTKQENDAVPNLVTREMKSKIPEKAKRDYQKEEMFLANDTKEQDFFEFGPFELEEFDEYSLCFKIRIENQEPEIEYKKLLKYITKPSYVIKSVKSAPLPKNLEELSQKSSTKHSAFLSYFQDDIYNNLNNIVKRESDAGTFEENFWTSVDSKSLKDKDKNSGPFYIIIEVAKEP